MKTSIKFAVVMTDENQSVLYVDNSPNYLSLYDWKRRFKSLGYKVLFCSQTDSLNIDLSHNFKY